MVEGIIFDVDGTILDSMHIWAELGNRYLQTKGIKGEEGLGDILYPMTVEESGAYLKNKYHIEDSVEKIISDIFALTESFYKYEVEPKSGFMSFINNIKNKGIKIGIATAGNMKLSEAALERLGILDCFCTILSCDDLKTSKREEYIFLRAAQEMKTAADKTVVFEDVIYGIKAAQKAGFITVGVEDLFSLKDREEIIKAADFYVADFNDPILEKLIQNDNDIKGDKI